MSKHQHYWSDMLTMKHLSFPRFFPRQFPCLSMVSSLTQLMPGRTIGKCASCGWQQCVESRPTSQNLGSTDAGFLAHGFFPHVWPYLIFFFVGLLFQAWFFRGLQGWGHFVNSVYLSFMSKMLIMTFCVCQRHNTQNGRLFKDVPMIFPMKSTSQNPNPPHKLFLLIHFIEGLLPNVGIDEDSVTALGFFHLTPKRLCLGKHTIKLPQKMPGNSAKKRGPFLGWWVYVTINSRGEV